MIGAAKVSFFRNAALPPALVVSHSEAQSGGGGTTSGINTTGATLIVVAVSTFSGSATSTTLSDSKGNTWSQLTAQGVSDTDTVQLFYCFPPVGKTGSGHTFTTTGAFSSIAIYAFSGLTTLDTSTGTKATSSLTVQPGTITPSVARSTLLTAIATVATTASIGSGFATADVVPFSSGVNIGLGVSYKILAAAAATNPTWTVGTGGDGSDIACSMACFK